MDIFFFTLEISLKLRTMSVYWNILTKIVYKIVNMDINSGAFETAWVKPQEIHAGKLMDRNGLLNILGNKNF